MQRSYLFDHKLLFLAGYIFYLFTPYIVGTSEAFSGLPGIDLYQKFFNSIPEVKLHTYLWVSLSWLPAFYLGHLLFSLLVPTKKNVSLFSATQLSKSTDYLGFLFIGVLIIFTYLSRASIFGGYGSYDIASRGKMSTLLVLFNFFLTYQLISKQNVSKILIWGTILTCFLLLTMGGRMYVFQTFLILLIYKTSFANRRWNLLQISTFIFAGFIIGTAFGLWRIGAGMDLEKSLYSLFAEPTFTWFSTSAYLTSNEIPYFNFPSNFLTSFLNLIPNTVFSFKPYIVSTSSMVSNYQNPLGADSVWSTIVINFGSIGSVLFIFITGFLLNFLKYLSYRKRFWGVYYILVCALLPFQFFRDGFYILHKQLYFNFLLFPGLILLLLQAFIETIKIWNKKNHLLIIKDLK